MDHSVPSIKEVKTAESENICGLVYFSPTAYNKETRRQKDHYC